MTGGWTPVQPNGVAPHSKLSMAKLVELRRRSRIGRARQLASNIETQAQILRATQIYNLEAARLQLDKQLGHIGQGIPATTRTFHEATLAKYDEDIAPLVQSQRDGRQLSTPASSQMQTLLPYTGQKPTPGVRPRHIGIAIRARVAAGNTTLDARLG